MITVSLPDTFNPLKTLLIKRDGPEVTFTIETAGVIATSVSLPAEVMRKLSEYLSVL